jgi:hypothetical protein
MNPSATTKTTHATALAASLIATITGALTTNPTVTKAGGLLSAILVALGSLYVNPPRHTVNRGTAPRKRFRRARKPFIMADSTSPDHLPSGLRAYAGYVALRYTNFAAIKARFAKVKNCRFLPISPTAAVLTKCLDIEKGCAAPDEAGDYVTRAIAAGIRRVRLYCELSEVTAVLADLVKHGHKRTDVRWFIAHPGKGKHICGPHTCGQLAWDADATQYEWAPGYDLSLCRGDFLDD